MPNIEPLLWRQALPSSMIKTLSPESSSVFSSERSCTLAEQLRATSDLEFSMKIITVVTRKSHEVLDSPLEKKGNKKRGGCSPFPMVHSHFLVQDPTPRDDVRGSVRMRLRSTYPCHGCRLAFGVFPSSKGRTQGGRRALRDACSIGVRRAFLPRHDRPL